MTAGYHYAIGQGRVHTFALVGDDVDITVDPTDAIDVGPASSVTAVTGGTLDLVIVVGGVPLTVSTALAAGGMIRGVPATTILSTSTVTSAIVTWGEFTAVDIGGLVPTGGATSALQVAGNTSLASIDSKTPPPGQDVAALSSPAVLPAAQEASLRDMSDRVGRQVGIVSAATLPLPADASTETTLAAILANTPTVGQKSPALSSPVVEASASCAKAGTAATTGVLIKLAPGKAVGIQFENASGGAVFAQIHDDVPVAGERPVWYGGSVANGSNTTAGVGATLYGAPCAVKVYLVFSSTQFTFTQLGSAAIKYTLYYV